jgi:uncharacterized protein (TIGR02588 family)
MSRSTNTFRRERTTFEWAILVVSLVAVIAIVAGLVTAWITYEGGPPVLRATVTRTEAPNRFTVAVRNDGGATAEDVRVLVRRGRGSVEVEILAVPKGDEEEATVTIGGRGRPTAQVQSYQEP